MDMDRRTLLAGAMSLAPFAIAADTSSGFPRRPLGTTGENVSIVGLGGFHLGMPRVQEAEAIRLVRSALDQGVNFLDNSWDYNDGQSEIRVGKALKDGYRQKAFVMTK